MGLQYDPVSNSFWGDSQFSNCLAQVMWHITNQCNLNCKFCFSKFLRNDTSALTPNLVDQNIQLFKKLGVLKLDISGGEPLLVQELPYIVDACQNADIAMTLTTSGMGNPDNLNWLMKNWDKFSRVIVSLDGPESIHNVLRGSKNAYHTLISFYQSLKDCGCDRIRINTVVTKQLRECQDTMTDLILSLNPMEWCCIEPHPANKVSTFDEVAISHAEFLAFSQKCEIKMADSAIHYTTRTKKDYSSYWTLYPNQLICHLSEMDHFAFFVCFSEDNYEEIAENVKLFPQYCINRRKEFNYGERQ